MEMARGPVRLHGGPGVSRGLRGESPDHRLGLKPHHLKTRVHEAHVARTPRPRSLARNTAVSATSAGSQLRRSGARWATRSSTVPKSLMPRADAVFTGPAEIAFTRIFEGPRSLARYRTEASSDA